MTFVIAVTTILFSMLWLLPVATPENNDSGHIKDSHVTVPEASKRDTIDKNNMTFVQLLKYIQAAVPNWFPKVVHDNKEVTPNGFNSHLIDKQSESTEKEEESDSFGKKCLLEPQIPPLGCNPQHKKGTGDVASHHSLPVGKKRERKGKVKAVYTPNDKTGDFAQNWIEFETLFPKEKPIKETAKKTSQSAQDSNVQNDSAAILINFNSGFSLPSIESILQRFSGYGIINKTETRFVNKLTAQVVFLLSANAKEAFISFQKNNPFGSVIESYNFQPYSAPKIESKLQAIMNGINVVSAPPGFNSMCGEPPNLMFIKGKLDMMTWMLESEGSKLAPEIKVNLECEVRIF